MRFASCGCVLAVCAAALCAGCMSYLTHNRGEAIVWGVDVDQSLDVAEAELAAGGAASILGVWCLRDQVVTPEQAARVAQLYLRYVGGLKGYFPVWHLTWAIADMYRLGDAAVRTALQPAYDDARRRGTQLGGVAVAHVAGGPPSMGDAHFLGHYYALKHLVVPGNSEYLQSESEYFHGRPGRAKDVPQRHGDAEER